MGGHHHVDCRDESARPPDEHVRQRSHAPAGQPWVRMTNERIEFKRAESMPRDATVRHYDELGEAAKVLLPTLVSGDEYSASPAEAAVVDTFGDWDGDIVKFTEYYRIRQHPVGSPS